MIRANKLIWFVWILLVCGCAQHTREVIKVQSPPQQIENTPSPQKTEEINQLHVTHMRSKMYGVPVFCPICNLKRNGGMDISGTSDIR